MGERVGSEEERASPGGVNLPASAGRRRGFDPGSGRSLEGMATFQYSAWKSQEQRSLRVGYSP